MTTAAKLALVRKHQTTTNVKVVLDICCLLAPTEREVAAFDAMYADMLTDRIRDREILIQLLSTLLDGLRYESWPILGPTASR